MQINYNSQEFETAVLHGVNKLLQERPDILQAAISAIIKQNLDAEIQLGLNQLASGEFISDEQLNLHVVQRRQKFNG